jgi:hypothetical protein
MTFGHTGERMARKGADSRGRWERERERGEQLKIVIRNSVGERERNPYERLYNRTR